MTDQAIGYVPTDASHTSAVRSLSRPMQWGPVCFAIILIAYGVFLIARFAPAIVEPDDNGYFAQGSLLATSGRTWFKPESAAQYVGMHWLITPDGKYVSRYPPGLAVIIALVYSTLGY